jgi:hypothetical protein
MTDEHDEIEQLTREALDAIQRLSVVVPLAIQKARMAGARETADRIAKFAGQFPEESGADSTKSAVSTTQPRSKRIGRGMIPAYINQRLGAAGDRGMPRRELRDQAHTDGIPRSSFTAAVDRMISTGQIVVTNGRLRLAHQPEAAPTTSHKNGAGAALDSDVATAPAHHINQEESAWTRPSGATRTEDTLRSGAVSGSHPAQRVGWRVPSVPVAPLAER